MHPVLQRFRLAKTIRTLLPANPLQIVFLLAAVCLSACVGRIWLVYPDPATLDAIGPLSANDLERWARMTLVFAFPLLFAGVGAYSCCILLRENLQRYWYGLAVAPAILGMAGGLFVPALIVLNGHPRSVLEKHGLNPFRGLRFPLRALLLNVGLGFQLAVLGLFLALLGGWLLRRGKVSLPVQFGPPALPVISEELNSTAFRQRIFAIYSLTLFGFGGGLISWPVFWILSCFFNHAPSGRLQYSFGSWLNAAQWSLYTLPLLLLALWTLGKNRRVQLLESARLPPAKIFGLALVLPIAVQWLPHVVAYGIDRAAWAHHWNATPEAPLPRLYLHIPAVGPHLILFAITAVVSEWCWRGCMQPQFIRTFGIFRGIFLLGILYGPVQGLLFPLVLGLVPAFFIHLTLQLIWGIVWSTIYGWLTLSARSVWPAAICAALGSMLTQASMTDVQEIIPRQFLRLAFLGCGSIVAFLLFRYLPLPAERIPAATRTAATSESAS